jgi:putative membrane protein
LDAGGRITIDLLYLYSKGRHFYYMQKNFKKPERRGFRDYLSVTARGLAMGAADVVPGVSGGTMAFILGIYEELINALHSADLQFFKRLLTFRFTEAFAGFQWRFLLALGAGIAIAILSLARFIRAALISHPVFVWAFFFGLVLASVVVVRRRISRWTPGVILAVFFGALGGYLLVGLVPVETPEDPWFLFLSGAIAINAMILPGISGAFVMVLLGKYHFLLDRLVAWDFVPILIMIFGAAVGLLTFVRVLRWLFNHFYDLTVALMMGLILGALRRVWPWKEYVVANGETVQEHNVLPQAFTIDIALAVALMAVGFALVLLLDYLASRAAEERGLEGPEESHKTL